LQTVESAVIAAAGLGSRLGLGQPKCMLEIGGRTLLSRQIALLERHVSTIHVVVGYREDLVVDYCARNHPKVVLVRNPEFRTTNTARSLSMGARHIHGKCIFLDGDLILEPESLASFIAFGAKCDLLVGLCRPSTENAVFVKTRCEGGEIEVTGFSREEKSSHEWANLFIGSSDLMDGAQGFVFEKLIEHLPLRGYFLEVAEVDTAADLALAESFARRHSL
jgi:choline kinase